MTTIFTQDDLARLEAMRAQMTAADTPENEKRLKEAAEAMGCRVKRVKRGV